MTHNRQSTEALDLLIFLTFRTYREWLDDETIEKYLNRELEMTKQDKENVAHIPNELRKTLEEELQEDAVALERRWNETST